jgi:Tol biopolymer transport system component/DNA-binding winged helix-turn-helix (wHTH) protein
VQPRGKQDGVVSFGPFEADFQQLQLRKRGTRIRLQAQPFHVLEALLENPGAVVTRDELRQRLWPENTFVDFEHGLNVTVTRLRQALGDSSEHPRYIETLAKRGYRFCGKVERPQAPPSPMPHGRGKAVYWAIAGLAIAGLGVSVLTSPRRNPRAGAASRAKALPLTAFRGTERNPAVSPDGSRVAFTWDGARRDNTDIYVMALDGGEPIPLTTDPSEDVSPAWSPDGSRLAFLRALGDDRAQLMLIPSSGGPEHRVREIRNSELGSGRGRTVSLSWSPDGQWIATSHRETGDLPESIFLFSPTGEARRVTVNPGVFGDQAPAFSPDGRSLVFSRMNGFSAAEVYTVSIEGGREARPLTAHKAWSVNPIWLPDGKRILYLMATHPEGSHELRILRLSDGESSVTTVPLDGDIREMTFGRDLVYSRVRRETGIWRARIARPGESPPAAELFISSTQNDQKPEYSPDGHRVAFTSSRSGSPEIWVAKASGEGAQKLTSFGGPLMGVARWSPDGQWLTFHSRPEGQADVYVMPSAGGPVRRMTMTAAADETMPSFSQDGLWIYYTSSQSKQNEIWKMAASGGEGVRVTTGGGQRPIETPDGKRVVYMSVDGTELRSVSTDGGGWTRVAGPLHPYPTGFAVTQDGVYYPAPAHSGAERFIMFSGFTKDGSRPVAIARHPFGFGLSVSPDGQHILFDQEDRLDGDLLLVKDFLSRQ